MRVERLASASEFARLIVPFLAREEAKNTLQLGLCRQLAGGDSVYDDPYMACVVDGDELVSVALMTPPFPVTVAYLTESAARCVADDIENSRWTTNGVTGDSESAACFATVWTSTRQLCWRTVFEQRIYQFWTVDDEPVTLIGVAGHSPSGARVGPVYTPPTMRRNGYGTAATAALSQRLLDAGRSFCCLYTDLANPTSNSIYQRIGYRPVSDSAQIEFSAAPRE